MDHLSPCQEVIPRTKPPHLKQKEEVGIETDVCYLLAASEHSVLHPASHEKQGKLFCSPK